MIVTLSWGCAIVTSWRDAVSLEDKDLLEAVVDAYLATFSNSFQSLIEAKPYDREKHQSLRMLACVLSVRMIV